MRLGVEFLQISFQDGPEVVGSNTERKTEPHAKKWEKEKKKKVMEEEGRRRGWWW